jgi:hypothetical protein
VPSFFPFSPFAKPPQLRGFCRLPRQWPIIFPMESLAASAVQSATPHSSIHAGGGGITPMQYAYGRRRPWA